jgi:hypothetical protein
MESDGYIYLTNEFKPLIYNYTTVQFVQVYNYTIQLYNTTIQLYNTTIQYNNTTI